MLQARTRIGMVSLLGNTGQFEAGEVLGLEVLALGKRVGDRETEAIAQEHLSHVRHGMGREDEALTHVENALALHEELDDPRRVSGLRSHRAVMLEYRGRFDEARAEHERAADVAQAGGHRQAVGVATGNLGNMLVRRGRLADAMDCYARCMQAFTEMGARRPLAAGFANAGESWAFLGQLERARGFCDRTISLAREIQWPFAEGYGLGTLAEVLHAEGKHEEAEQAQAQALECYRGIPTQVADAQIGMAALRDWSEDTRPLLEEALEIALKHKFVNQEVMARCGLACAGGDQAAALAVFKKHEDDLPVRMKLTGRYLLWRGSGEAAHLKQARAELDGLLAHAPVDCREGMVKNVPVNRAVMEG